MTFPFPFVGLSETPGGNDANTLVLLHCDGTNASTTFTNSGGGGNTVAAQGNAQISTANPKFGTGAALLDGTGDYLAISDTAAMDFGTSAFTLDWWERRTASGGYSIARTFADTFPAYICTGDTWFVSSDGANWNIATGQSAGPIVLNQYVHKALVRSGNNFYAFHNGLLQATWTSALGLFAAAVAVSVGAGQSGNYLTGNMDEVRISNVARWTSDFQPRSAAYS